MWLQCALCTVLGLVIGTVLLLTVRLPAGDARIPESAPVMVVHPQDVSDLLRLEGVTPGKVRSSSTMWR